MGDFMKNEVKIFIYNEVKSWNTDKLIKEREKILNQIKQLKIKLNKLDNKICSQNIFVRISHRKYISLSYEIEKNICILYYKLKCVQELLINDQKRLVK